jgi:exodeoxyribonuclease VII small subunit
MTNNLPIPNQPTSSTSELTYEQAVAELESIVAALESAEHPLGEALALYQRGQMLAQHCTVLLDQVDLKVQQLVGENLADFAP